jgi:hypothetical protein
MRPLATTKIPVFLPPTASSPAGAHHTEGAVV